ncbi:MAG: hypothetical protein F4Z51_05280 [Chloroflexi bacterium]|nr:hypothetical protein [Chloroflexota bacterium]MYD16022.1 hypothetical protein [Chloroflexota bacterium]
MSPQTDPNPFAPTSTAERAATETHMREIARRRWQSQQEQRRRRQRRLSLDRVKQIHRLRPGRAVANSLSPVYNMFTDNFLRRR